KAGMAMDEERFAEARCDLLQALARNRATASHARNEQIILSNLAFAMYSEGDLDGAAAVAAEALAMTRSVGDARTENVVAGNIATIAALRGRYDEAIVGYER